MKHSRLFHALAVKDRPGGLSDEKVKRSRLPFRALALTALLAATAAALQMQGSGAAQHSKEPSKKMNPPGPANLELTAAPSGGRSRLLPEEAAVFDLVFRNLSSHEEPFQSMTGNDSTPVFQLYDAGGRLLGRFDPATMRTRATGHTKFDPAPPAMAYLRSGVQDGAFFNLWNFTAPLPPGKYRLDVSHQPHEGGAFIHANPVSFEVVPAVVTRAAMNYGASDRSSSLLSWIAQAADKKTNPELLIRLSAYANHGMVQQGASPAGPVESSAQLASSALPPFSQQGEKGWLAIASGEKIQLIHHVMAQVDWRSGPIAVPLANLRPVAGFPDRQQALFLATGRSQSGAPALLGLALMPDPARNAMPVIVPNPLQPGPSQSMGIDLDTPVAPGPTSKSVPHPPAAHPAPKRDLPPYHPWTISLKGDPIRAAAAFDTEGPVSILLVYDDHGKAQLSRIDVDESGKVLASERLLLTGNQTTAILAVAVDQRKGHPISFLVLGADRNTHNRLALIRLPLDGPPVSREFPAQAGWPMKSGNGHFVPLAATEVALDVAQDGTPWLAMIDETGRLYGGPVNGSPLSLLRDHGKCSQPFVAALGDEVTPGCFTETGQLFPAGNEGHRH